MDGAISRYFKAHKSVVSHWNVRSAHAHVYSSHIHSKNCILPGNSRVITLIRDKYIYACADFTSHWETAKAGFPKLVSLPNTLIIIIVHLTSTRLQCLQYWRTWKIIQVILAVPTLTCVTFSYYPLTSDK